MRSKRALPTRRASACDVTVVSVTYQSARQVTPFLEAARQALPSAELLIVDNASRDGTCTVAQGRDDQATIISLQHNEGFGRAANLGVQHARGRWLIFANPDVRLERVSIPDFTTPPNFGLAGALVRDRDGKQTLVRAEPTIPEEWLRNILGRFFPPMLSRFVPPSRTRPPAWTSGALFVARRDEFLQVGGFDPRYFLYCEDRDLGRRYRECGFHISTSFNVVGTHTPASSSTGVASFVREGWALLSWLEYQGIWRGQDMANLCAKHAVATLRVAYELGTRAGAPSRIRRKAEQAGEILRFTDAFDTWLAPEPLTYYPHARAAVAAAGRSWATRKRAGARPS